MFGSIGITELLIIFVVALVVIGPKRMPDLAKSLGRALRDFKRATSDFQDSVNLETDYDLEPSETDKSIARAEEEENKPNQIDPPSSANPPEEDAPESGAPPSPGTDDSADEPPKERT